INQRDGFFLVSRKPAESWQWTDLEGSTLIPVGFTPVPIMSLKAAMKRRGVSIDKVRFIEGLSAEDALARFRNRDADYIHLPNPQAQELVQEGAGFIATPVGIDLGYICYSSFAATPEFIESRPETVQKFVNGFYKAQKWLAVSEVSDIAVRATPLFPGIDRAVITASIRSYKDLQTWADDPLIGEDGYDAMRDLIIEGGLVRTRAPYERLVRPEFAMRAMAE
ncbi:MAG: ABC transporter substrate-binding protein, partial [Ardenticatenaceae bacterium]